MHHNSRRYKDFLLSLITSDWLSKMWNYLIKLYVLDKQQILSVYLKLIVNQLPRVSSCKQINLGIQSQDRNRLVIIVSGIPLDNQIWLLSVHVYNWVQRDSIIEQNPIENMENVKYEMKPLSFYDSLVNPEFVGQSRVDMKSRTYIMVFKGHDGVNYGFECAL